MGFKKKLITGAAAASLLLTSVVPYNVFADEAKGQAEQPPLHQYLQEQLKISQIAQYDSGVGEAGTEILAFDAKTKTAFVTNGAVTGFDIISFADLKSGEFQQIKSKRFLLKDLGLNPDDYASITSIAVSPTDDLIAISASSKLESDPGHIIFAKKDGSFVKSVEVGSLPDMVTFTPDGKKVLVANEGEPRATINEDTKEVTTLDSDGSISVIDAANLTAQTLTFEGLELGDDIRLNSNGTPLQQLEPEYITVSDDGKTAYVSLQENNAIATIDLTANKIVSVKGLGVIDHSEPGNEMDAIPNGKIEIEKQPILTFHMPDAIDTFTVGGKTYIITPNEGDARAYEDGNFSYGEYNDDGEGYTEEKKLKKLLEKDKVSLKASNYANYTQAELNKFDLNSLADYKLTIENGLNEKTGKYEAIYGYGGRSFSIFDAESMEQVYDSGSEFEQIIAKAAPKHFNTNNDELKFDGRSNAKGVEPETAVTGVIGDNTYAFIALERFSGIMIYDVSNPEEPQFVDLISSRDFSEDIKGDVSPEGLQFIPAEDSPTGKALLAATHEVSGTVAVYELEQIPETFEPAPTPEQDPVESPKPDVADEIERIQGYSRYDTAIEVSKQGWEKGSVEKVILASGQDFADALAGVPLAAAWDTPILLTPSNRVLDQTIAEINRLGAKEVTILGGEVAVSKKVTDTLEKAGLKVDRINGHSRYDTAVAIANELTEGKAEKVVVANGKNFADALSVASLAARDGLPILLTQDSVLTKATKDALNSLGAKDSLVLGGDLAISEKVAKELPGAKRISGGNRYATNIAILEEFGVNSDAVYVANGKDYADALSGAVLAAKEDSAVVLVHGIVPEEVSNYLVKEDVDTMTIFGGPVAVGDKVKEALDAILEKNLNNGYLDLTIMHTNDTHANLDNVAKRVTAVKEVRAEEPNALLLDAGDVMSGTLYYNEFQGMADLRFMNLMGYDAMTFGNHEFDLGSTEEGLQGLADFVEGAKFPFVSSNVDFTKDDKFKGLFSDIISSRPADGHIYNGMIREVEGEKVGIFGLTTAETADLSSPGAIEFEDYIKEAERAVKAFEGQGVDKIVALTHIGYDDNPNVDNDLTLAAEVDGIDVIVGGHSHTQLNEPVIITKDNAGKEKDPTVIVQAYQYNNFLGKVDVEFNDKGEVVAAAGKLIDVAEKADDQYALGLLEQYSTQVEKVSQTEIGATAESALLNPRTSDKGNEEQVSVRKNETPLGNLITDGMLAEGKEYDEEVVMAFQNGGGIRAAINEGPITVGEVITVLPFGNTPAVMELTGAEIKEAFEISVGELPYENGGFLHVAGGKVEFDSSKPAQSRVISVSYQNEDGSYTEIQDKEIYKIVTNAFTAKGGDGYTGFGKAYEEGRVTDLGSSDWENFANHLAGIGNIVPKVEGRIVDVAK
ncbi:choice-of-anchor I family protein [Oceanobacillus chungangensis]|uniref:Multifunctional 2',3'-cyclic-nucleotide 2'-phosphodiesterase/5'-nucleotidase/3'-nucleotidase n=1 Tax=Oceanobacillus chungangensis TaxID=1229152 RepID=A0A3D8PZ15_9BACI|nr:choice-of-anchor I family protein [Oceanobacillus chungangensis]RDW20581.1 hypothetical protein CWR45_04920 [Oceanobacillus chungangensis]